MSDPPERSFARYTDGGATLLRVPSGGDGTARHGYGPPVVAQCGYKCAYCGLEMAAPHENWLNLSVDHVVPVHLVKERWPREWVLDLINVVTCCRACNEFLNRYRVADANPPVSIEACVSVRDRVFDEIVAHAQERHVLEKERYVAARASGPIEAQEDVARTGVTSNAFGISR